MNSILERGRALAQTLDPELEQILKERYDDLLPNCAVSIVENAYGRVYSRDGLDIKSRYIATIAALTVQGSQTHPQLRINIKNALKVGVSQREICEIIFQMSLYGGMPATINALNLAKEIFAEREK